MYQPTKKYKIHNTKYSSKILTEIVQIRQIIETKILKYYVLSYIYMIKLSKNFQKNLFVLVYN